MGKFKGFTLVELITVMILLGILSLYVVPKFSMLRDDNDVVYINSLIDRLRLVQEIDMNRSDGSCVAAVINRDGLWHQECDGGVIKNDSSAQLNLFAFGEEMLVDGSNETKMVFAFDSLGNLTVCQKTSLNGEVTVSGIKKRSANCSFTIGSNKRMLIINTEGYIYRKK